MDSGVKIATIGLCLAIGIAAPKPAAAISVELAKKCRALALQAHPYRLPGVKGPGTAAAERSYYAECVAKGGNMPQSKPNTNKGQTAGQSSAPTTNGDGKPLPSPPTKP